jgi:dolichol-phosphate mannosyltransferase
MGVSYYGRTYEEGKKIGARDGFRALYCILKYNFDSAPIFLQLLVYSLIGGIAAVFNLLLFALLLNVGVDKTWSAIIAFGVAAAINYALCVLFLFRHQSRWSAAVEFFVYAAVVLGIGALDIYIFTYFIGTGMSPMFAKATACIMGLVANFAARKWLVFSGKH